MHQNSAKWVCATRYHWSWVALLDVFTIPPLLMTNTAGYAWLSFSFLRAVRANLAFERLEGAAHPIALA